MPNQTGAAHTMEDWQKLSRQYWDAWSDATRKAFGSAAGESSADPQTPWLEGLEQWSRMFDSSHVGDSQNEVVERLLQGARSYFSLLEAMAHKGDANADPQAWTDALRQAFNFPGAEAALLDNPLARALRELAGKGAQGFEQMLDGVQPALRELRQLLDLPAFGYTREHQEHYQRLGKAWLDYQHETNRYNTLIARASRRAFEVFEDKLAEHAEPGRQIDSVRGLYDLWVDAAEDAYAEVTMSDEFRHVYGALVNAQMRVRRNFQQEVEKVCNDLGMPTRTEVDSMGKRLHDLRRDARDRADALPALVAEVAALRAEVEQLKAEQKESAEQAAKAEKAEKAAAAAPAPAKKAAPRRAAARKSVARSK